YFFAFNNVASDLDVTFVAEGDLNETVKFQPETISLKPQEKKPFAVLIKHPASLEPGEHIIYITADEQRKTQGTVAARGSIRIPLTIRKRYPGILPIITVGGSSAQVGDPAKLYAKITNLGDTNINSATAKLDVFDADYKYLTSITTDTKEVPFDGTQTLNGELDTYGYKKGEYYLNGTITADGQTFYASGVFRLGELNVNILNVTKKYQTGIIQKADILVQNDWNNPVKNIYGQIIITDLITEKEVANIKTPLADLNPWQEKVITGYWDLNNVPIGKYSAAVNLFYADKTTQTMVDIEVVEDLGLETMKEIPVVIESPKFSSSSILLVALIVALILLNIWLFISLRRKKSK
ncbi:MAG: hypothetical protein U9R08_06815, partial [Nanoarchaeota archaeon]|nr:hypothetical protein [Nanoarchaeota archaeon]